MSFLKNIFRKKTPRQSEPKINLSSSLENQSALPCRDKDIVLHINSLRECNKVARDYSQNYHAYLTTRKSERSAAQDANNRALGILKNSAKALAGLG
ncbi:MAG: hypothetical protein AABZ06_04355, partial [Bdellovibrionota bacterium]